NKLRGVCSIRRGSMVAAVVAITSLIQSCNMSLVGVSEETRPPDLMDTVRSIDLQPRLPRTPEPNSAPPDRRRAFISDGGSDPLAQGSSESGSQERLLGGSDGFDLNFENAPVTTVAKVILGDILKVGYTIDPRVQGTISLASGRPIPKSDMLYVLEN